MQKLVIIVIFISLAVAGCKSSKQTKATKTQDQAIADKNNLKREWMLKTLEGNVEGNKALQSLNNKPYLNLTEDIKGFGGCNTIGGGKLESKGDKISFDKIFSTRMACAGNEEKVETLFLAVLNNTKRFKTEGHFLMLFDENDKKLATLVAIDWD